MKKLLTSLACLLLCFGASPAVSFAQIELFGGYSHLRLGQAASSQNANGWDASLSTHLIGALGLEADYSNHYGVSSTYGAVAPGFTELYGPRFQLFSFPRIEPYVHALFGTAYGVEPGARPCPVQLVPCPPLRQNAFAMAFGGGLNIKATRHIWVRLFQVDYLRANFSTKAQNDARISAGLVLRFGKW
ncbi:MAG: hypothetical protein ACRD18_07845 [Terriglobia bacterium]